MTDKQLAEFLSRVKLTEKLEPRVIEDLEALHLGPLNGARWRSCGWIRTR